MVVLSILLTIFFGGISAYYAQIKGRDPVIWFVLGTFAFLLAIIVLYFLPPIEQKVVKEDEPSEDPTPSAMHFRFREWFYLDTSHKTCGPLTFSALKDLYYNNTIASETFLWSEGLSEWTPLDKVDDLKDFI